MVEFINYQADFRNNRLIEQLTELVEKILRDFRLGRCSVTVVLCGDAMIRSLNREYRGLDKPTDVLSFSQDDTTETGNRPDDRPDMPVSSPDEENLLGDVIVSLETARRQAEHYKVSEEEELARLVIHGTLHLLGYDHERSDRDEQAMFEKQDAYLEKFLKTCSH